MLRGLAIGAAGGALFAWLELPLAWMIGAMVLTTAAAVAGAEIALPPPMRSAIIVVLGVMLGSAFTPDLLGRMPQWGFSLAALLAYIALATAGVAAYYRRAGYDRTTAYFAAAPGGLAEMMLLGAAAGGDERAILLSHGLRILLLVLVVPFGFRLFGGYEPAAAAEAVAAAPLDLLILAGCGLLGFLLARPLRIPAPALVGPMALSAAVHLAGLTASRPPEELVALAQLVMGTAVGCRFVGIPFARLAQGLLLALGATAILLALAAAFALLLPALAPLSPAGVLLAFAPGGLAEMSLIALALGIDAAFVSAHHVARIFLVVMLLPPAYRLLRRRRP